MGSTTPDSATTPAPTPARTSGPRPACEHPDFPLGRHPVGQWYKKIKGKPRYFGAIAADPTGERAWAQYAQERPFWEAGQDPRRIAREMGAERKLYALWEIAERWLEHRFGKRRAHDAAVRRRVTGDYNADAKKIAKRTYDDSMYAVKALFKWADRNSDIMGWPAARWAKLHEDLGRGVSPATWGARVVVIRTMAEWAVSNGMLPKLPKWGDEFPTIGEDLKQAYRFDYQREHGERVFDVETARTILEATDARVATAELNKNNTSGHRGVSRREDGTFEAYVVRKRRGVKTKVHLGEFATVEEAAAAYRAAAEVHGIDLEQRMKVGARLFCACNYLAANTGAYSKDIGSLWLEDLELERAYLDRKRSKSGEYWQAVLWPETVTRIADYLRVRPEPDRAHRDYTPEWEQLAFLSSNGLPINWDSEKHNEKGQYLHTNRKDLLKAAMRKLLIDLGIKDKGVNFGAWRHTFESLASDALGLTPEELQRHDALYRVAARKIPNSRNRYVKLPLDRLRPIVDTVRTALWPDRVADERRRRSA